MIFDDKPAVFTVKDGVAVLKSLVLGQSVSGRQIVTSGLNAGDTIVTVGQAYLSNGTKVKISRVNGR